jgi:hypothetical protein
MTPDAWSTFALVQTPADIANGKQSSEEDATADDRDDVENGVPRRQPTFPAVAHLPDPLRNVSEEQEPAKSKPTTQGHARKLLT